MQHSHSRSLVEGLRRLPVFRTLSTDDLETLAEEAVGRAYTPGAIVFLENEPAVGLYYLQSGWLKIVKISLEGREQILQFVGPGETFNLVGLFTDWTNPATAIALEASQVWLLRRESLTRLFRANPQLALHVLEAMAHRLQELVELVSDLSLRTVEARLARQLLESAQGGVVVRQRWATQAEMAARLGTVPDVVSRVLRSLVLESLIEVERHQIRILNPAGLADRARLEDSRA